MIVVVLAAMAALAAWKFGLFDVIAGSGPAVPSPGTGALAGGTDGARSAVSGWWVENQGLVFGLLLPAGAIAAGLIWAWNRMAPALKYGGAAAVGLLALLYAGGVL
jgi:hypothetical protein